MSPLRISLAVVAGLLLGTIPFARYAHFDGRAEAHADHEPHHGGQLGMVGDHHVELVRRGGRVEVYVSDAWRRAVRPTRGSIAFEDGAEQPLAWKDGRLVATDRETATTATLVVVLSDGTRLAIEFDAPPGQVSS